VQQIKPAQLTFRCTINIILLAYNQCESSLGSFDECRTAPGARRLLDRLSAWIDSYGVHIHHRHCNTTHSVSWYSFYRPTVGQRLSRPGWVVTFWGETDIPPERFLLELSPCHTFLARFRRPIGHSPATTRSLVYTKTDEKMKNLHSSGIVNIFRIKHGNRTGKIINYCQYLV